MIDGGTAGRSRASVETCCSMCVSDEGAAASKAKGDSRPGEGSCEGMAEAVDDGRAEAMTEAYEDAAREALAKLLKSLGGPNGSAARGNSSSDGIA